MKSHDFVKDYDDMNDVDLNGSDEDIKIIKPRERERDRERENGHGRSKSVKRRKNDNNKNKSRKDIDLDDNRLTEKEMFRVWLTNHVKLPQYYDIFVENGVEDFRMVMDMTINELKMIGVHTKKHQLQIQKEITKLRNQMKRRNSAANLFDTV